MNEDQFEALKNLMRAIAAEEAGRAVHQYSPKCNVEDAEWRARVVFGLPLPEEEEG